MLKIEDVKVGDALEVLRKVTVCKCAIDAGLIVTDIFSDKFITSGGFSFDVNEINLFKKKEKSQYTFDDLVDVTRKAFDDGVLQGYAVENKLVKSLSIKFSDTKVLTWHLGDDDYSIPIGHIQSLYKETFVIETEADLKRVKSKPKITLNNCEVVPFTFKEAAKDHLIFYDQACGHNLIPFVFLKGATVEQERGRDDKVN